MKHNSKLLALLGAGVPLIGLIITYAIDKKDKYVMHYSKQGAVLFALWIIVLLAVPVFATIPVIGWVIEALLWIGLILLWIIGIIYSLSEEFKDVPIIGVYAKMIRI